MLQIHGMGAVTELIHLGNKFMAIFQEFAFSNWSRRFQKKVPYNKIHLEDIEVKTAFLVEMCCRFGRHGFWDAPAWTNDG